MSSQALQVKGQTQNEMLMIISQASLADSTKTKYGRALVAYLGDGQRSIADFDALVSYSQDLSKSGRGFLKAAVRLVTDGLLLKAKASATPTNLGTIQAGILRIEALQGAIKVESSDGKKSHTWLSQAQVKRLVDACGDGVVGQRDRVVIGLLVGAGLRRQEAATLRFEHIKYQPVKGKMRCVLNVKGKGGPKGKWREVPVSDRLADALDKWQAICGDGFVCRSLGRSKQLGEGLSGVAVFQIARKLGKRIGLDGGKFALLAAHDLRRTYAQLGYEAGVPITQLCKLLGHKDIKTTMTYLNLDLDLESTASDFIPFEWSE